MKNVIEPRMNYSTLSRYATLFLYAAMTYLIFYTASNITFFQKVWFGWLSIAEHISENNLILCLFQFTAGVSITKIASEFSVYHKDRPCQFNLTYPSLMFSVILVICLSVFLQLEHLNNVNALLELVKLLWLLLGLAFLPLIHTLEKLLARIKFNKAAQETQAHILSMTQHIANQLQTSLDPQDVNPENFIALCGRFGVGKTTAIELAVQELQQKTHNRMIHCNIDLWGVKPTSVIAYVLDHLLIELSRHIDMSRFRSFPSEYLNAMKGSAGHFKILAILLDKPNAPEHLIAELNRTLEATNRTLLVSIQDLDRNEEIRQSLNELAGFLERVKGNKYKNISYIFAGERTPEFSQTLLRICPTRLDFGTLNFSDQIAAFEKELLAGVNHYYKDTLAFKIIYSQSYVENSNDTISIVNAVLPSARAWLELRQQVQTSWSYVKYEVLHFDLILLIALKNNQPLIFDILIQLFQGDINTKNLRVNKLLEKYLSSDYYQNNIMESCLYHFGWINPIGMPDDKNETEGYEISKSNSTWNIFSPFNIEVLNSLLTGFVQNEMLSKKRVYDCIAAISQGDEQALEELCLALKGEAPQGVWKASIEQYGYQYFYNNVKTKEIAISIVKKLIEHTLIYPDVWWCFAPQPNDKKWFAGEWDKPFAQYLFSEQIADDFYHLKQYFDAETMYSFIGLYVLLKKSQHSTGCPFSFEKSINNILRCFIVEEETLNTVLMLSFIYDNRDIIKILSQLNNGLIDSLATKLQNATYEQHAETYFFLNNRSGSEVNRNIETELRDFKKLKSEALKAVEQAKNL